MNIRYRCPTVRGAPMPGHIIMGDGPRTRRAYRVLGAFAASGDLIALGCSTWNIKVEAMSADAGRREIADGCPHWGIKWDSRKKGARRLETVDAT